MANYHSFTTIFVTIIIIAVILVYVFNTNVENIENIKNSTPDIRKSIGYGQIFRWNEDDISVNLDQLDLADAKVYLGTKWSADAVRCIELSDGRYVSTKYGESLGYNHFKSNNTVIIRHQNFRVMIPFERAVSSAYSCWGMLPNWITTSQYQFIQLIHKTFSMET